VYKIKQTTIIFESRCSATRGEIFYNVIRNRENVEGIKF